MFISDRETVSRYFQQKLNLQPSDDFRGVIFLNKEGQPGVAYGWHGFIGRVCAVNIVIEDKHTLTKSVAREAFRFPFEVCGCNSVLAFVDSANAESMELCQRAGFIALSGVPDGGLLGDLIIFEMPKDNCRWLRTKRD